MEHHITPQQRVEVIKQYYLNKRSIVETQKNLRTFFGSNQVPSKPIIQRIMDKFENQYTLADKVKSGRGRGARTEQSSDAVSDNIDESPGTSSRRRANEFEMSPTSLCKIMNKDLHLDPGKIQLTQQSAPVGRGRKKIVDVNIENGDSVETVEANEAKVSKTTKGRSKKVVASPTEAKIVVSQKPEVKERGKKAKANTLGEQKVETTELAAGMEQTVTAAAVSKGRKKKELVTSESIVLSTKIEPTTIEEEKAVPPKKRTYGKKLIVEPVELNGEDAGEKSTAIVQIGEAAEPSPKKSKTKKMPGKPKKEKITKSNSQKVAEITEESSPIEDKPEIIAVGRGKKRALKVEAAATGNQEEDPNDLNGSDTRNEIESDVGEIPLKKKRGGSKAKPVPKTIISENIETEEHLKTKDEKKKAVTRGRKRPAATSAIVDEVDGTKPSKSKKATPLNSIDTIYNKADFDLLPLDDDAGGKGKRFNFKISSWNVAGLRSWLKKEGLKILDYEEPDIFCLQETKCIVDQMPEEAARIPGYHPYWLCKPGGYAGVAIYSKIMPIHVEYGIGNPEFDEVGRIITAEYEKFFLICVYVPNSGRNLVNLEARMRWEQLFQAFVKELDARKPVIICGDMNVSHQEIDLANPKANTRNAGFTKEERDKMTELLNLGFVDSFRHFYPTRTGAYTFWTYMGNARSRNVGWRLDYFLVSERFINRVVESCIRPQCKGSDHCPITLFLNL